jgi:hypothetical protein
VLARQVARSIRAVLQGPVGGAAPPPRGLDLAAPPSLKGLAPVVVAPRAGAGLELILGKKGQQLLEVNFDGDTLPKGWSSKSGKLRVADGALRASQTKGERLCLFSCVQTMQDAAIQIDFKLGSARGINVSCNPAPGESKKRGHLFSVMITPAMWNITKHQNRLDPNSKVNVLASAQERFEQGQWYTLVLETKGDDVVAQVEGKRTLRAADKDFRVKKPGIEFRVSGPDGGEASFDNLRVWVLK